MESKSINTTEEESTKNFENQSQEIKNDTSANTNDFSANTTSSIKIVTDNSTSENKTMVEKLLENNTTYNYTENNEISNNMTSQVNNTNITKETHEDKSKLNSTNQDNNTASNDTTTKINEIIPFQLGSKLHRSVDTVSEVVINTTNKDPIVYIPNKDISINKNNTQNTNISDVKDLSENVTEYSSKGNIKHRPKVKEIEEIPEKKSNLKKPNIALFPYKVEQRVKPEEKKELFKMKIPDKISSDIDESSMISDLLKGLS
jgi:hypothetical protein